MPYASKQKDKEFHKQYYLKHREASLTKNKQRYQQKKLEILAYHKDYFQKNKSKILLEMKKYRTENKDKYRASIDKWMLEHKEEYRAWKKQWTKEYAIKNRAKIYARDVKRRELKKNSKDETTDMEKIRQFYILAETLTLQMGEKYVVDHVHPIIKGGKHHQDNLQVITMTDNLKKGAKYPFIVENRYLPADNCSLI